MNRPRTDDVAYLNRIAIGAIRINLLLVMVGAVRNYLVGSRTNVPSLTSITRVSGCIRRLGASGRKAGMKGQEMVQMEQWREWYQTG